MSRIDEGRGGPPRLWVADREGSAPLSRRHFLLNLGLLAGAGVVGGLSWPRTSRGLSRVESSRTALGTWVRIVARHRDPAAADRAIDRAWAAIARVDAQMSVHRSDSELARVNAAAGRQAVTAGPDLIEVVRRARAASLATGRVYDPTILPLMRLYGFYRSGRSRFPTDRQLGEVLDAMGPGGIELDEAAGTIGLAHTGAALDLGSIGKGWALDRAVDALRGEGITSGLVDIGRNVYGLGAPDEGSQGWRVGAIDPGTGAVDRVFLLNDSAVGTSSNAEQWIVLEGVRVGHLFDGRSGHPSQAHRSATVHARTGLESDLGSTLAFLLGHAGLRSLPDVLGSHFTG